MKKKKTNKKKKMIKKKKRSTCIQCRHPKNPLFMFVNPCKKKKTTLPSLKNFMERGGVKKYSYPPSLKHFMEMGVNKKYSYPPKILEGNGVVSKNFTSNNLHL